MSGIAVRRFSIGQLPMLNRTMVAREALMRTLQALLAAGEPGFAVTIDGERQDDAMLALVRPVIETEIRARMASLDRDIEAMGVIVSN